MKAPDKVFFPNDINLMTKLSLVLKQKGDVCYIRKDALLEWAKETYLNENTSAIRKVCYKQLIDKLNSL